MVTISPAAGVSFVRLQHHTAVQTSVFTKTVTQWTVAFLLSSFATTVYSTGNFMVMTAHDQTEVNVICRSYYIQVVEDRNGPASTQCNHEWCSHRSHHEDYCGICRSLLVEPPSLCRLVWSEEPSWNYAIFPCKSCTQSDPILWYYASLTLWHMSIGSKYSEYHL